MAIRAVTNSSGPSVSGTRIGVEDSEGGGPDAIGGTAGGSGGNTSLDDPALTSSPGAGESGAPGTESGVRGWLGSEGEFRMVGGARGSIICCR